jgi:hypothetical protein
MDVRLMSATPVETGGDPQIAERKSDSTQSARKAGKRLGRYDPVLPPTVRERLVMLHKEVTPMILGQHDSTPFDPAVCKSLMEQALSYLHPTLGRVGQMCRDQVLASD